MTGVDGDESGGRRAPGRIRRRRAPEADPFETADAPDRFAAPDGDDAVGGRTTDDDMAERERSDVGPGASASVRGRREPPSEPTDDVAGARRRSPRATEPTSRRGGATVPASYLVIAVLVAAALAVLSVVALVGDEGTDTSPGADGAREAAAAYSTQFLSLDHERIDGWRDDLTAVGTPSFAEEIDAVAGTLGEIAERTQTVWRGQVIDVYIGVVDGPSVSAVVRYDLAVSSDEGSRQLTDHYLRIDLVRGDGQWLIDSVTTLTLAADSGGGSPLVPDPTDDPVTPDSSTPTTSEP